MSRLHKELSLLIFQHLLEILTHCLIQHIMMGILDYYFEEDGDVYIFVRQSVGF
jgi:hypothetical protein